MEKQEREKIEELITECRSVHASGVSWDQVQRVAFVVAPKLADAAQQLITEVDNGRQRIADLERTMVARLASAVPTPDVIASFNDEENSLLTGVVEKCEREKAPIWRELFTRWMSSRRANEELRIAYDGASARAKEGFALVANLEKRLAEWSNKTGRDSAEQCDRHLKEYEVRIADLEKRLAEAKTPIVDADGKTPGTVDVETRAAEWFRHGFVSKVDERTPTMIAVDEAGAQAVLRAFGGDALRNVRSEVEALPGVEYGRSGPIDAGVCQRASVLAIIDSEIAKLGQPTAAQPSVDETQKRTLRERFIEATQAENQLAKGVAGFGDLLRLCDLIDSR
jgi:hypothetical protein